MKKIMNFRFVPMSLAGLIAGILCIALTKTYTLLYILLFAGFLCGAVFGFIKKLRTHFIKYCAVFIVFVIGAAVFGASAAAFGRQHIATGNAVVEGVISSNSKNTQGVIDGDFVLQKCKIDGVEVDEEILISHNNKFGTEKPLFFVGDRIRAEGVLRSFSLDVQDSKTITYYKNKMRYEVVTENTEFLFKTRLSVSDSVKMWAQKTLNLNMTTKSAGFTYAMFFGDRQYIDQDTRLSFSRLGTAHIFAVSGLHIGILSGAIILLLRKLRTGRWAQFLTVSVFCFFYNFLCGFAPSIVRASLMVCLALFAKCVGMKADKMSIISLSAVAILLFKPIYLFELSFLMSFCAVFALAAFAQPITAVLAKKMPKGVASVIGANIAANIGLLPIMLCCFGKINLLFVIANTIVIPIVVVLLPLLAVALLLAAMPVFGYLLSILAVAVEGIILFCEGLAKVPFLEVGLSFSWQMIAAYVLFLVVVSKYIFAPRAIKTLLSCGMIIVVAVSAVLSMPTVLTPKGSCFVVSNIYSGAQSVLIKGNDENILIINGEASQYDFNKLKQIMFKYEINTISTIVSYDFSKNMISFLTKYHKDFGIKNLVSSKDLAEFTAPFAITAHTYYFSDDLAIMMAGQGRIIAEIDKAKILFAGAAVAEQEGFDFIFSTTQNINVGIAGSVAVGVLGQKQSSPCFTFKVKNGKIDKLKCIEVL